MRISALGSRPFDIFNTTVQHAASLLAWHNCFNGSLQTSLVDGIIDIIAPRARSVITKIHKRHFLSIQKLGKVPKVFVKVVKLLIVKICFGSPHIEVIYHVFELGTEAISPGVI